MCPTCGYRAREGASLSVLSRPENTRHGDGRGDGGDEWPKLNASRRVKEEQGVVVDAAGAETHT